MEVKSSMKNMLLCLSLTTFACSAILAVVYTLTSPFIQKAQEDLLTEAISYVLPKGLEVSLSMPCEVGGQESEYYIAKRASTPVAYAIRSQVSGFGGPLVLLVGILADGTIYKTSVLLQNETPGLGAKCSTDERFISQWENLSPRDRRLLLKKDGGDIDAITASTITSRAYTLAVQNAVEALDKIRNKK